MTNESRGITLGWPLALALVVVLVGAGAASALWWTRSKPAAAGVSAPRVSKPPEAPADAAPAQRSESFVTLTPEMSARAGIVVEPVSVSAEAGQLRIPGTVQPNAYRQVVVTAVVSGRVTSVQAALGDRVSRGQALAQLYSPELADAQTAFAAKRAEVEAAEAQLKRTERLVGIGAASRQELELLTAEHTRHTSELQGARARLVLLGIPASRLDVGHAIVVSADAVVTAPIAGVVIARAANVGVNVDPSTPMFTLVDLSSVWIEGDVHEKDFGALTPGTRAIVTTAAYPDLVIDGKVSYIDPQVRPETRTAKVRVEVPNPSGRLKLGMFAEVTIASASTRSGVVIPRSALQTVGNRDVVYVAVAGREGQFAEREVQVGEGNSDRVQVLAGLKAGELVVTQGSFFLRAERERVAPRVPQSSASAPRPQSAGEAVEAARVEVTENGFQPSSVTIKAGQPIRIAFVRRTDKTCATEVAIPSMNLKRSLPLNQPVPIDLPPSKTGEIAFTCGMNMLKGTIVVR
jgi:cobalt-zinc-cadmium efflux system membrane fusion protein